MTKSELPYLDCVFLGPVLMYVNQSKGPFISERILLNVILVSFFGVTIIDVKTILKYDELMARRMYYQCCHNLSKCVT